PIGLISLDLDHFKRFNDRYGHETGDVVLRLLSKFVESSVRGGDIACRYGGEEFLLVLPEASLAVAAARATATRAGRRAVTIPEPQSSGVTTLLTDLARGLQGAGVEVHVFGASGSEVGGLTFVDTGVDPADLAGTLLRPLGSPPPPSEEARLSEVVRRAFESA